MTAEHTEVLFANRWRVTEGLSEKHKDQIIRYTKEDPAVVAFTSDQERFSDREHLETWLGKGRSVYPLVDPNDDLHGIIWFGEKESGIEDYGITFAIRLYTEARGKGFARPFMAEAFTKFMGTPEYHQAKDRGIWLEVSEENAPAVHVYEQFGFETIQTKEGKNLMILPFLML